MERFTAVLVPGTKPPYNTWTFVELPGEVPAAWGKSGPYPVRGTLAGAPFRGTVSRSGGVYRLPVTRDLLDAAGVQRGDTVEVTVEIDEGPREAAIPAELEAVLASDPQLRSLFEHMAPSHRRAWATYIGEAKRAETRLRRAGKAAAGIRAREFPR